MHPPEPSHWSKSLGDILTWDEHAKNYYGQITERRYDRLPEDHDALMQSWVLDALAAYTTPVNPFLAAWRAFKAARWANLTPSSQPVVNVHVRIDGKQISAISQRVVDEAMAELAESITSHKG